MNIFLNSANDLEVSKDTDSPYTCVIRHIGNLEKIFLPLTGGTITDGNLILNRTTDNEVVLRVSNPLRTVDNMVGSSGIFGFYDITRDEWILYSMQDGSIEIPHTTTINGSEVLTTANIKYSNGVLDFYL